MKQRRPVAIFVSRFPPPDESFLDRELEALQRCGQPVVVFSLADPWKATAIVRALIRRPRAIFAAAGWIVRNTLLHLPLLVKSLAVLPIAADLAERLPKKGIAHIHAHFATHAATAAWVASKLTGIPFSMTVHAHALFVQRALLREKVRDAAFVRTISEFNRRFLESLYPEEIRGKVHVVHCGARTTAGEDAGATAGEGAGMTTVACPPSTKPHKGVAVFLEACRMLEGGIRHSLGDLANADIVVQPSVIAPNGQMDGIPIPLIDAMAAGKAVIASAISGIPELVVHGETGLLVDPANPRMLADAIRRLADDPALRERLGANAREQVAREFSLDACARQLIALLDRHNPELPA